jgi:mannosyltransferase
MRAMNEAEHESESGAIPRPRRRGVLAIPTMLTVMNVLFGFITILLAMRASEANVLGDPLRAGRLFQLACWALIVVAVVALIRSRNQAVVLLLGWVVLPMGILIFGNAFIAPMYTIRYLSFCTPAVAILVAFGVCALFSRGAAAGWIRAAAVLALVALALPTDVFQRTEFAKDGGSDLRQAAQVIGTNAKAGDAVVFDETAKPSRKPRLALRLYPQYFSGLSDVTLRTPYTQRSGIWDSVWPIAAVAPSLETTSTVWDLELVTPGSTAIPANIVALERLGYSISRQIPVHRTVVYELTRETS